jgi:hypothetical protein
MCDVAQRTARGGLPFVRIVRALQMAIEVEPEKVDAAYIRALIETEKEAQ